MTTNNSICTAFFHIDGTAPNLKTGNEGDKLEVYCRCMIVFFASARAACPKDDLFLFTNKDLPIKYAYQLEKNYSVNIVIISSEKCSYVNGDFKNSFPGCLFTLDVIDYLSKSKDFISRYLNILFLDSDCIIKNPKGIFDDTAAVSGLVIDYELKHVVNGQSRASLTEISNNFYQTSEVIKYYGGEFYCIHSSAMVDLSLDIAELVAWISKNTETYGISFTEEHILSVVLSKGRWEVGNSNGIIKRIWTANTFNNYEPVDENLSIYHLPAEKDKLLKIIFESLCVYQDGFLTGDLHDYISKYLHEAKNPSLFISLINGIKTSLKRFL